MLNGENMNFIIKNQQSSRYVRLGYIAFALVIAVLYDLFFWKQENGIAFLLFTAIYLVGFLFIAAFTNQFRQRWALLLLLPITVLSIDVIIYNNSLVHYLVTKAVFLLSVVFSLLVTLSNPQRHPFSFRYIPLLHSIDLPFTKWDQMYKDLFRWNGEGDKDIVRKIAIGLVVSLPILFIFTALFMQADAVFSQWLKNIFDFTNTISLSWLWRIVRALIFTIFIGSFFYAIFADHNELGHKEHSVLKLDRIIVGVVLALINSLFLIFVFIQFKYLFGSSSFVLENGLAYAEYARKGFFELAWVVGLASLLVIAVYRSFVRHGISRIITALQILLVGQVGIVAVSALKRMYLYQDAYGFTVLRLYVEWSIYLILIVLAFTIVSLLFKISFRKFWYVNLIVGVLAFTTVATVNVDKMIAKENIDRFLQQGKELDLTYLDSLSTDILPVFNQLLKQENLAKFNPASQVYIADIFKHKTEAIAQRDTWREWHIGDAKNRYFTIPPAADYYDYINQLRTAEVEYANIEAQIASVQMPSCDLYKGVAPSPFMMSRCYPAVLNGKNYVFVLDLVKNALPLPPGSRSVTGVEDIQYTPNFYVYERVTTTNPGEVKYSQIYTKSLPVYTSKDYDFFQVPLHVFLSDGRVVEKAPKEKRHYLYNLSIVNNQFNLVRSGPLEK
jgi:hypothetical protein